MTSDSPSPATPPPPPARSGSQTALRILLIIIGIVLVFPGVCSLAVIVILSGIDPRGLLDDKDLVLLWILCFVVAAGGIMLIRYAVRRYR